jgi:hypothetical protein
MPLLFCQRCAIWWDSLSKAIQPWTNSLPRCPHCRAVLVEKAIERPTHQPRTELRPGVAAEWED